MAAEDNTASPAHGDWIWITEFDDEEFLVMRDNLVVTITSAAVLVLSYQLCMCRDLLDAVVSLCSYDWARTQTEYVQSCAPFRCGDGTLWWNSCTVSKPASSRTPGAQEFLIRGNRECAVWLACDAMSTQGISLGI